MYQDYFQLAERPFTTMPFAPHYCPLRYFDQSLNTARHAISEATGPAMIIGAAGVGKSMFLEVLQEKYRAHFRIARLTSSPDETRTEILQSILFELDRPYQGMNEGELRLALMDFLKPSEKCPNGVLVLVDDAHLLSSELLSELNSVSSFVRDGKPRVRLVLAGKSKLEETLTLPSLDSLAQRIAARCYLQSMTKAQTKQYIDQHLLRTGRSSSEIFETQAIELIAEISQGIPRVVNQICCHAMILTADNCSPTVTEVAVSDAWQDIQQLPASLSSGGATAAAQIAEFDTKSDDPINEKPDNKEFENGGVVEFGNLGDDASNDFEPHENTVLGEAELAYESVDSSDELEPIEAKTVAQETNIDVEPESVERPTLFLKYGDEDSTTSEEPSQDISSPSQHDHSDTDQSQRLVKPRRTNDESIFGSGFEQEEIVADPFSQWAAQQNRCSLDVTDSELAELMAHAEIIKQQLAEHEICTSEPEVILPGSIDTDQTHNDMDSPDFEHNNTIRLGGAEPDTSEPDTSDEHEVSRNESPAVETNANPDNPDRQLSEQSKLNHHSEYPLSEHDAYLNPSNQAEASSSDCELDVRADSDDDRDILLVSHQNQEQSNKRVDSKQDPEAEASQGHAMRMDYRKLFETLREPTKN